MTMRATRQFSPADRLIGEFDKALRTVFGTPEGTGRANPADAIPETAMSEAERTRAMRLMRVNHCGEVCAQALYQGQALTARDPAVSQAMQGASDEENDHLLWCEARVKELDGRTSVLDPLFYLGSLGLGVAAGLAGDKWSLGFLAETERQVVKHLAGHLDKLPAQDQRSRAIVEQMKQDEGEHATHAVNQGAAELPMPIKGLMRLTSKAMTRTTYWI